MVVVPSQVSYVRKLFVSSDNHQTVSRDIDMGLEQRSYRGATISTA